ncbi:MAG: dihydroxyacetone kinase subunit L [Erysipelotrichaceae bacterium]|nr:dihydroxyacetone kinase subunit L [Erysipelotrichaceae bacterium]
MVNTKECIRILVAISNAMEENAQFLTDLDAAIGDSDHGINLSRGFKKVEEILPTLADKPLDALFKKVGMTLVSTVGGASGPLYGTAFMKAGAALKEKEAMNIEEFIDAMEAAVGGVQMRGKAQQGEKTMLDAMIPAVQAMNAAKDKGQDAETILQAGVQAAKEGVEYTKTIIATKGRASYLGERSIGHQDPGATSFTILLETIANEV